MFKIFSYNAHMSTAKTSTTAFTIADSLAKLSQVPRWKNHCSDEMVALNIAFTKHACDTSIKHLISALPLPISIFLMDTLYIAGMTHHYLFRKIFIEKHLHTAIKSGAQQVIVLGGGMDTLALRMAAEYPQTRFIEIDLPHTQARKMQVLKDIGHGIPENCIFTPADLSTETLENVLHNNKGFRADAPSLVIIEGVLMYLTESEVKTLFSTLHQCIKAPLTILFGAMTTPDQAGHWRLRIMCALLRRAQEETKWYCTSSAMPTFMKNLGYEITESITYKDLQRPYRSAEEISHVPEEDENYYIVKRT